MRMVQDFNGENIDELAFNFPPVAVYVKGQSSLSKFTHQVVI